MCVWCGMSLTFSDTVAGVATVAGGGQDLRRNVAFNDVVDGSMVSYLWGRTEGIKGERGE